MAPCGCLLGSLILFSEGSELLLGYRDVNNPPSHLPSIPRRNGLANSYQFLLQCLLHTNYPFAFFFLVFNTFILLLKGDNLKLHVVSETKLKFRIFKSYGVFFFRS
jgi:hypothetical protein